MKRYILTGTPGSGKTVLIRYLENLGYNVLEEAATDVISLARSSGDPTPWTKPEFIEKITRLQIERRKIVCDKSSPYQFSDRSPYCTLALAEYLGFGPPAILLDEITVIKKQNIYEPKVFFIENLGYCQPTQARTISFEEALRFEKIHESVYHAHGLEIVKIPKQSVSHRVKMILSSVAD